MTILQSSKQSVSRRLCILIGGCMLLHGSAAAAPSQDSPAKPSETAAPAKPVSLEEWRALRKKVSELFGLPSGAERIAACEAFLREHPDHGEVLTVLGVLIGDYSKLDGPDSPRAVGLLERMVEGPNGNDSFFGLYVVEEFYLPQHLAPESAMRILARTRRVIEANRSRRVKSALPPYIQANLAYQEFELLLDEGRVLLQSGDTAAALKRLQQAEAKRKEEGLMLSLQDPRDREARYLPSCDSYLNWLYLGLAEAYEKLGQSAAAAASLGWVKGSAEWQEDFDAQVERLQADLKLPSKETHEYRGEPTRAADFTLEDLEGTQVRLSDYAGKTVLLLLWATW